MIGRTPGGGDGEGLLFPLDPAANASNKSKSLVVFSSFTLLQIASSFGKLGANPKYSRALPHANTNVEPNHVIL